MAFHTQTGKRGEEIAKEYLRKKGYKIREQNYRTRYAEIDLVTERKNTLVFVEVRTKIGERFGSPEDTINKKKLWKLQKNAEAYIARIGWQKACRVDAVCIVLTPESILERIDHYENILP